MYKLPSGIFEMELCVDVDCGKRDGNDSRSGGKLVP